LSLENLYTHFQFKDRKKCPRKDVAIQRSNRRAEKVKPMISTHTIINAYKILASNPHENRPLQRSTYKHRDKIKVDDKQTECKDMGWIPSNDNRIQWRAYMNMAMNLQVLLSRDVLDQLSNNFCQKIYTITLASKRVSKG